jgi:hypothetical protein
VSGVLATTPPRTQAAILHAVLGQKYPKLALPTIAGNFKMTLADLKVIIDHHGYPRTSAMQAAAIELEQQARPTTPVFSDVDGPAATEQLQHAGEDEAAQAAAAEQETADGYLVRVPVHKLHADPDNVREVLDDIEDLAASIKESGSCSPSSPAATRPASSCRRPPPPRRRPELRWTDVDTVIVRPA